MRAFLVGGSGQIARAVAERLLRDGWEVVCAQRGDALPELVELGATSVSLDRNLPGALQAAVAEGADAIIDTVAFDDTHAEQLLEIQDVVGQLVVISSASVYCDDDGRTLDEAKSFADSPVMPNPITEKQRTTEPGPQTYSTKKVALENALFVGARVPLTIVRPCAIYGTPTKHPREWWLVKRRLDGRQRVPLAAPDRTFHTSATPNIAEVIRAALHARFRGILNAGDPDPPSVRQIAQTIASALDWGCEFVDVPSDAEDVGVTPWSGVTFVVAMEAARRIGYVPATSYPHYAPEVCRWLIEAAKDRDWREIFPVLKYYGEMFDYAREDEWLSAR
ncbi:MAG: NAD(P)H-binding protein [Candidatus Eremiobacteraeota bacterium]|nr:NAD(P)H-binding protein [Candidatus Eremiobacteraeota bacterium]